jgi:hypothetical protein
MPPEFYTGFLFGLNVCQRFAVLQQYRAPTPKLRPMLAVPWLQSGTGPAMTLQSLPR